MKKFRAWLQEDDFVVAKQAADARQRENDAQTDAEAEFYKRKREALEKLKKKGKSSKRNLNEARSTGTSLDDEALGHLTHTGDIPHEDPRHSATAVDLLRQFHNLRLGLPSTISASLKHDGGSSVHIKPGAVSDKHRFARGVWATTPEEIDEHFGHQPQYAAALKELLAHSHSLVRPGRHVQGDLLWTPNDEQRREMGGTTTYTPNRITYKARTKAPVGIALHTEVDKKGVARAISDDAFNRDPNIYVPEYKYKPDPENYSEEDRAAFEHHMGQAEELLRGHTSFHLTPEHAGHFTIYCNRTTRRGQVATVDGYIRHLRDEGEKAASKLKSEAGQNKKRSQYEFLATVANTQRGSFQRSLAIRHHLRQATERVLSNLRHPDIQTSIDGKDSAGEGVVLAKNGQPMSKLVPVEVSNKILNNPRFGRGEVA